ncbi:hypothetical protein IWZ01DRAFT_336039 [Phyllosticta capitalensis]
MTYATTCTMHITRTSASKWPFLCHFEPFAFAPFVTFVPTIPVDTFSPPRRQSHSHDCPHVHFESIAVLGMQWPWALAFFRYLQSGFGNKELCGEPAIEDCLRRHALQIHVQQLAAELRLTLMI